MKSALANSESISVHLHKPTGRQDLIYAGPPCSIAYATVPDCQGEAVPQGIATFLPEQLHVRLDRRTVSAPGEAPPKYSGG